MSLLSLYTLHQIEAPAPASVHIAPESCRSRVRAGMAGPQRSLPHPFYFSSELIFHSLYHGFFFPEKEMSLEFPEIPFSEIFVSKESIF